MLPVNHNKISSIENIQKAFKNVEYICSRKIATTLYLAFKLNKPILVEGPAGVGKTDLANKTAAFLNLPMVRLQCYEGLDESKSLYEWKYGKQLLYTQILKDKLNDIVKETHNLSESIDALHRYDDIFFSKQFLEPRPLLSALQHQSGSVLLVDEIDKSDDEFEAFLLEILSDFQVSIPEIGTIKAETMPFVFLTSNNTRELSDALKRRCLHLYIPFPEAELEREIITVRVPDISESLRVQLVDFIQQVRKLDIKKLPSISETIDWAKVLLLLHADNLSTEIVRSTLNVFLKFENDISVVNDKIREMTQHSLREAGN
jgi:MoxR-like ATPase